MLYEAEVAIPREYQVVEQGNAEGVRGFLKPDGDIAVLGARLEPARGVVVRDDDRASAIGDGIGVDFAWMDDRRPLLISTIRYRRV